MISLPLLWIDLDSRRIELKRDQGQNSRSKYPMTQGLNGHWARAIS